MPSSPASADLHPLLARIAGHAAAIPDESALLCDGVALSYSALWAQANAVAAMLGRRGLAQGDRVALAGERGAAQFADLLGVLIAGGVYVPLGEKAPPARQAMVIADAGARFVLSAGQVEIVAGADPASEPGLSSGYILYTSGSTGRPKGVRITLDNVAAYVANLLGAYPLLAGTRVAQIADIGFDASVHEIFTGWAAGATVCVIPTRHVLMWPRYFRDLRVEVALLVPSQVRMGDRGGSLKAGSLPALRRLFLGAELVTGQVVRQARAAAPAAELVNLWGPTEGTVALTHHSIGATPEDHEGVPIGLPWSDQTIVLDGDADGAGEMLAAGSQISPGYWRLPERDAESFARRDGATFYRTGDRARRDAAGDLVFTGRRDRQVKIRGHRIELEECECAIRRHAGSGEAIVIVEGEELVCFLRAGIDLENLVKALRGELPAYMLPGRFVAVAAFPLTASGKVDRNRLREMPPADR